MNGLTIADYINGETVSGVTLRGGAQYAVDVGTWKKGTGDFAWFRASTYQLDDDSAGTGFRPKHVERRVVVDVREIVAVEHAVLVAEPQKEAAHA